MPLASPAILVALALVLGPASQVVALPPVWVFAIQLAALTRVRGKASQVEVVLAPPTVRATLQHKAADAGTDTHMGKGTTFPATNQNVWY